ncbi:MAG: helix-turn-helix domain-containing protein [Actinomycetota bacterium]|nr:helix-turn-helix domain-containing protein [Chloroflexota bacterium]MDQ3430982.1 helix-turn-helix domain-containing protein [Actinomycetota bacterium]
MSASATGFGGRVRKLRVAAGLTQAELAERAGISERTVSDLERGLRGTVYPATARQLAASLGVGSADLSAFLSEARSRSDGAADAGDEIGAVPGAHRARVPAPLTRLLGRESELAVTLAMVRDPDVRLLTLVGLGGIGKTRLATEVATLVRDDFAGGVHFVGLSAVDDPDIVPAMIADAVGLAGMGAGLPEALAQRLGQDRALLVLDTFEHLLAEGPVIGELLAACPGLTALVTSRTPLHLRGEWQVPVQPLAVRIEAGESAEAPAVELFLERAAAVEPAFESTPDARALVSYICSRLDGLPLAIELAAARVRHMPLATLRTQLDHRLDALVGGARDLPLRQQTMRATMDWSYALLDAPEMRLFRGLAAFRGGFGKDAAAAMIQSAESLGTPDVMPALSALVDASLVILAPEALEEGRYRMLELSHDYAVERSMAAREFEGLRLRHAEFFLRLAERAEPELRGAEQREWYARLFVDEGNFRAAMTWALEAGKFDLGLRMAGALWMFWRWAGLFAEGRRWLDAALAGGAASTLEVRCQGLWGAGWLAYHQGDYHRTREVGAQMLSELGEGGHELQRRNAHTLLGNAALGEGRDHDAIQALSEAVTLTQSPEGTWHQATSLLNLGTAQMHAGQVAAAGQLFERAQAIYEELGDRHFLARTLIQIGYAELLASRPVSAALAIARAMEIVAEIGDGWGIAEGLEAVAALRSFSQPRSSVRLAAAAEHLRERISMRQHAADAVINRRYVDRARERMTAEAFAETWREGRALTLAEALAEAPAHD